MSMNVTGNVSKDIILSGIRGQYSLGEVTAILAASTNGDIFQFRWADPSRLAAIRRIMLAVTAVTPFAAAPIAVPLFTLQKATGWTVNGTGGFAEDFSTGAGRRRTQTPSSLLTAGAVRTATTAALGAGTKTLDAAFHGSVTGIPVTAVTGPVVPPTELLNCESSQIDYPLLLTTNEGFVINLSSNPGTGTMVASFQVEWMEING